MKIRQHKGSLDDSMKTLVELDGSLEALNHYVQQTCGLPLKSIALYDAEPDTRINFEKTFIGTTESGVFGFADCNIT